MNIYTQIAIILPILALYGWALWKAYGALNDLLGFVRVGASFIVTPSGD